MRDDNPHLRSVRPMTVEPPTTEDESGLPTLGERQYVPHARPANKPIHALHFVAPAGDVHSFQYVHLDSYSTFTTECITLKFLGMQPTKILIRGRNLWRMYDYIHQHRIAWVMQAAQDFAHDGQTIVTDISFVAVAQDDQGGQQD